MMYLIFQELDSKTKYIIGILRITNLASVVLSYYATQFRRIPHQWKASAPMIFTKL
jgi:hypothetical protein